MGTRSIYIALTLTAAFIILSDYVFNDKSRFCMLPEKFKKMQSSIDSNDDKIISEFEIKNAMEILEKAKKQRDNRIQLGYLSFYDNVKV
jgi:DNA-binding MltR family transcriptional regulator